MQLSKFTAFLHVLPVSAMHCRAELLSMNTGQVPPAQLRQGLTALCINKAPGRSTYRGTRAGLGPHRTIPVIVTCVRTNTSRPDESRGRYLHEIELSPMKCQPTAQPLAKGIKLGVINCRSIRSKTELVTYHIKSHNLDLVALTETWLRWDESSTILNEVTPPGYSLRHVPRERRGGGLALVYQTSFKVRVDQVEDYNSFEHMTVHITSGTRSKGTLVIIYRSPSAAKAAFFRDFWVLLEHYILTPNLILVGDFNIHADLPNDSSDKELADLLDSMCLTQHVDFSIHIDGHTLDLIISREPDNITQPASVSGHEYISDHCAIHCILNMEKPMPTTKVIQYRRLAAINKAAFKGDLEGLPILMKLEDNISTLVDQYCQNLSGLVEKHAPLRKRRLRVRPHAPWFTQEIEEAKVKRRQYEALWRKSGLTIHREMFKTQRQQVQDRIKTCKARYFSDLINSASSPKVLFGIVDKLLYHRKPTPLPEHLSAQELASWFSVYFNKKIVSIRNHLNGLSVNTTPNVPPKPRISDLVRFNSF